MVLEVLLKLVIKGAMAITVTRARPFIAVGIPTGGLFTGAEGVKTADEAAMWNGTAGDQYDPCYHQACDTFDNINLAAFDVNTDAVAFSTLQFAMNTEDINSVRSKGNFKLGEFFDSE